MSEPVRNMNELSRLSSLVFGGGSFETLTAERELELIEQAQTGESAAFWELCTGYARALRALMKGFRSESSLGLTQAREELLEAFGEQVLAYDLTDTSKRLAYSIRRAKRRITETRDQQALSVDIPRVPLDRLRKLSRDHDGDLRAMIQHAPDENVSSLTMRQMLGFKHSVRLEPDTQGITPGPMYGPGADDSDLVAIAFASIADDPKAIEVMQLKYGFDDPTLSRRRSDGDVAEVLSCGPSTVGRIHAKALSRMRVALGVEGEGVVAA